MKKTVLLFNPQIENNKRLYLPLGLLYVAAPLLEKGLRVVIIDQQADKNWQKKLSGLLNKDPVCIGISSFTGIQIRSAIKCAKLVRRRSDIPIIWGGVHPTMLPAETLRSRYVDIVVMGEGEYVFAELVDRLINGKDYADLQSIGYKKGRKINISERGEFIKDLDRFSEGLPYHLLNIERYIPGSLSADNNRTFDIATSRGCAHDCAFCYNKFFYNCTWRSNSVDNIIRRVKEIKKRYSIDGVHWREDNFFVDRGRVEEICRRLISGNVRIRWHANCRLDYFLSYTPDFMKLLKKSGCQTLGIGVESASQSVLRKIKKGIRSDMIMEAAKKAGEYGISILWHFMVGFPFEKSEDLDETINLAFKLMQLPLNFIHGPFYYLPYPNTGLYRQSVKAGFVPPKNLSDWGKFNWQRPYFPISKEQQRRVRGLLLISQTAIHSKPF